MPFISLGHFSILKEKKCRNRKIKSQFYKDLKKKKNKHKPSLFLFLRTFASGHILSVFLMSQSSSKSQKTQRWEFLLLGELFTSITTARVLPPRNYTLFLTVSICLINVHTYSLSQLLTAALERMVKITSLLKRIFGVWSNSFLPKCSL